MSGVYGVIRCNTEALFHHNITSVFNGVRREGHKTGFPLDKTEVS